MNYRKKAQELTEARIQLMYAWDRAHGRITLLTTVFAMDKSIARSFAEMLKSERAYFEAVVKRAMRKRSIVARLRYRLLR